MVIQIPEVARFTWILGGSNVPKTHFLLAAFLLVAHQL